MADKIRITTPLTEEQSRKLKVGDSVLISGVIYSARDAAHKVMTETLARGENFQLIGAIKLFIILDQLQLNLVIQLVLAVLQLLVVWTLILLQCSNRVLKV